MGQTLQLILNRKKKTGIKIKYRKFKLEIRENLFGVNLLRLFVR
jgi:hypothetical protein